MSDFFKRNQQVDFEIWKGEGTKIAEIFLKEGQR